MNDKRFARLRRAKRTRMKIREQGLTRLSVHRSSRHIYAQVISDDGSTVIASASTSEKGFQGNTGNKEAAASVGKLIAERAKAKGVERVAFDRSGFKYHGRVQALAEAARLYSEGALNLRIDKTFPMARIADAHALSAEGHVTGKLVMMVS